MESLMKQSERSRLRELLARLDRVATLSHGHRAGLHLYDPSLFDQYVTILITWQRDDQDLSTRSEPSTADQSITQAHPIRAARI